MDLDRLAALTEAFGRERLVLDLSCRRRGTRYFVVCDRWRRFTDLQVDADTLRRLAEYCAEFLVHGVDVEGRMLGIDEPLIEILASGSPVPCTYAGGVASLADLERVRRAGGGRVDVTVGSALDIFGGPLAYEAVVAACRDER